MANDEVIRTKGMVEKHILDVTCGTKTIWFNKNHPCALYCDKRSESFTGIWKSTVNPSRRTCEVKPDVVCDFTDLPFDDDSFELVVFDPPHIKKLGETSWMRKKYGDLSGVDWKQMIHDGFYECMRVLKPYGTLIFKWSEVDITVKDIVSIIDKEPLFGHRSGRKMKTHWMTFMKGVE